jgi:DNA-binding NtrC family response regulator
MIDRVGGGQPIKVDIRILATSNRDLRVAVRDGQFREDLLFRLNVVNLALPPLRDRPEDVRALADHFARKYAAANGAPHRPLNNEAQRHLLARPWPGNVRELENTIHRAVLLASGPEIGPEAIRLPDGSILGSSAATAGVVAQAAQAAESVRRVSVGVTVAQMEQELIIDTLSHCLGNRTHAATILGISIRTLRNKLRAYLDAGVRVPHPGEGSRAARL